MRTVIGTVMIGLLIVGLLCMAFSAEAVIFISGGGAAAPSAFLAQERFEGGSSTGGGDSDNELTWTNVLGSPDFNYTGTVLQGSESAFFGTADSITDEYTEDFTAQSGRTYITTMYRSSLQWAAHRDLIIIKDSGGNNLCRAQQRSDTSVRLYNTGGSSPSSSAFMSADTTYYFKIAAEPGTGSDAECTFWMSTDGSSWADTTTSSDGTWTADIARVTLVASSSGSPHIFDDIRIDDSDIDY